MCPRIAPQSAGVLAPSASEGHVGFLLNTAASYAGTAKYATDAYIAGAPEYEFARFSAEQHQEQSKIDCMKAK